MKDDLMVPPEFQRLQITASKDESRYNLCGVHFYEKHAVATDGHILAVRRKPESAKRMPENENLVFNSPKAKKRLNDVFTRIPNSNDYFSLAHEVAKSRDCEFPDWKQVVPEFKQPFTIHLSAGLLNRLVEALRPDKRWDNGCSLTFETAPNEKKKPMLVTTEDFECFGVIMPMIPEEGSKEAVKLMNEVLLTQSKE